ncbi:hypothetical protein B7P43_G09083 [Cryptotermes secundus]|uniref:E3 ubiquitin-protein ligase n=1 Tax=Cryptotermes secundus TaxID=105785 RepID=A0A2J7PLG5_9NEOP|nr:hypothetical protein B7P43_G09083 [Cryptotermes secundus]
MPGSSAAEEEAFKGSGGCFEKFKRRTGIHSVVRHGEAASSDTKAAEKFIGDFKKLMDSEGYLPQQVFNCDETGEDIVFLATDINLPGAVDWVMMQSCFGHHFMLVLEKQEKFDGHQQFFAIVQLIGSRKQAENFAYRLELNGQRRRLTWEATPRSIHEGVSSAIMNSDCLVFDTSIAQLFADNGNLGINVTISMV